MARRKRQPRSVHLKKHKRFYDPYSDYALRTRGQKVIDLVSPIPTSKMISAERENVRFKWQSLRLQNLVDFHRVVYRKERTYEIDLFFHGQEFYWIEQDLRKGIQRRSVKYETKVRADWAYDNDCIIWAESVSVDSVSA